MITTTFKLPYYAVIFTSILKDDIHGYVETAEKMEFLAKQQPGFLGVDSARESVGITVSYWQTEQDIIHWKHQLEHAAAREKGKTEWYKNYSIKICKVERQYAFNF